MIFVLQLFDRELEIREREVEGKTIWGWGKEIEYLGLKRGEIFCNPNVTKSINIENCFITL